MVAAMSSKNTICAPVGAILGTVASSSVARVSPIFLPAMSAALRIWTFFAPAITIDRAPCGGANITVFARSNVIESDEIATSARPASSAGMRCGLVTCTSSSSTPRSFASCRAVSISDPSGWLLRSRMPNGGDVTSAVTRIFFSLMIRSSTPPGASAGAVCASARVDCVTAAMVASPAAPLTAAPINMSLRFMVVPPVGRSICGDVAHFPVVYSGRGRVTRSRIGKFLRERISQHGNLVPDADAAEAPAQRKQCRSAAGHKPAQRFSGRRSGREQSLLGGDISRVVEILCAAETVRQIIMAEPPKVESRCRQYRFRVLHATCRFDEGDGEDRFVGGLHLRARGPAGITIMRDAKAQAAPPLRPIAARRDQRFGLFACFDHRRHDAECPGIEHRRDQVIRARGHANHRYNACLVRMSDLRLDGVD